jgi:hypothetical protein
MKKTHKLPAFTPALALAAALVLSAPSLVAEQGASAEGSSSAAPAARATSAPDVYAGWTRPGPPPLERFVEPLGLSADQQAKLRPIFAEAQAKAAEDDAQGRDRTQRPEAVAATMAMRQADLRVRLATVLTPAQMQRFESLTVAQASGRKLPESHPAHGHSDMNSAAPDPATRTPSTTSPETTSAPTASPAAPDERG